jgi:hypothetical protein
MCAKIADRNDTQVEGSLILERLWLKARKGTQAYSPCSNSFNTWGTFRWHQVTCASYMIDLKLQAPDKCVAIDIECSNVHVIAHTHRPGRFQEYVNTVCLAKCLPSRSLPSSTHISIFLRSPSFLINISNYDTLPPRPLLPVSLSLASFQSCFKWAVVENIAQVRLYLV